jgi:hypothetical protein
VIALSDLSGPKLLALIERRREVSSATCRACIEAGLGNVRFSDLRSLADQGNHVAAAHVAACDLFHEALDEQRERQTYHGSDKPIRRAA